MPKTMFAADAALDSLLASSSPAQVRPARPKAQAPAKTSTPKPAAKAARRAKPLPASAPVDTASERQQLNVEIEPELFAALNLRKTRAQLSGDKKENSYCKIIDAALRQHLAYEVELASSMKR